MKVSAVIPCYRSAETVGALVDELDATLGEFGPIDDHEILLVHDGSPDRTGAVLDQLASRSPRVSVIHLERNRGQHAALVIGIRAASGDLIVTLDDDGQHRPDQIALLIQPFLDDPAVDLVYGVPVIEEHGLARSLASRSVKATLAVTGNRNARWIGAFRAFRTRVRDGFPAAATDGSAVNVDVLLDGATDRVVAVSVDMNRRAAGRSTYSVVGLVRHSLVMLRGFRRNRRRRNRRAKPAGDHVGSHAQADREHDPHRPQHGPRVLARRNSRALSWCARIMRRRRARSRARRSG